MQSFEQTRRYCRDCGAPVTISDAFCTYCGERLGPEGGEPSYATRRSRKAYASANRYASSRLWPPNARREIIAGILVAAGVAGLLVGLIYAFLALSGLLGGPSVPQTLGLIVFSLIHGGGVSADFASSPSLFGIGGSFQLGLPMTSFALLPFLLLLILARIVARRTETTFLFASATAITYAAIVALLAALGTASVGNGSEGVTVQWGADPFSAAWRSFVLAGVAGIIGAAASRGPLLPERPRQVLRGAFAAIGVSLVVTVLLALVILTIQGFDSSAQQVAGEQTTPATGGSSTGGILSVIGMVFASLPTLLSTLWLLAHGLPLGLQGAQDLASLPLVGPSLAQLPLKVSLLGTWPLGGSWRLLLLGPVVGFVIGGMLAAGGAPRSERWWQGALVAVPYTVIATLIALLSSVTLTANMSALTFNVALGASLPWLLALLPVGGALGALGGLLARSAAWAPNPRRTFLLVAAASVALLLASLPSAVALQQQEPSELLNPDSSKLLSPDSPKLLNPNSSSSDSSKPSLKPESKATSNSPSSTSNDAPDSQDQASDTILRQAVQDYYEAVDREDWDYTYQNLDSQTQRRFTKAEWEKKNQWFADNIPQKLSSIDIDTQMSSSGTIADVTVSRTFTDGSTQTRDTIFVYESGSWKHRFSQEELDMFMPGVPFEEFVKAQQGDSSDNDELTSEPTSPSKPSQTKAVKTPPKTTDRPTPPNPPEPSPSPSPSPSPQSSPSPQPSPAPPSSPSLQSSPSPKSSGLPNGVDCSTGVHNVPVVPGSKGDRDGDGIACE